MTPSSLISWILLSLSAYLVDDVIIRQSDVIFMLRVDAMLIMGGLDETNQLVTKTVIRIDYANSFGKKGGKNYLKKNPNMEILCKIIELPKMGKPSSHSEKKKSLCLSF